MPNVLGRFYEFRPEQALNHFISPRKRYENGERELADPLAPKKKTVEVFAYDTRFNGFNATANTCSSLILEVREILEARVILEVSREFWRVPGSS